MKKVVFAIVLLAIILTAGILENFFVHRTFTQLDDKLAQLEGAIIAQDDVALEQIRSLTDWWEKQRNYLELLAYSPDLRAFSVALAETDGSLQCGDFDNALSKCQSLMIMSKNIHRILDFNVEDIV